MTSSLPRTLLPISTAFAWALLLTPAAAFAQKPFLVNFVNETQAPVQIVITAPVREVIGVLPVGGTVEVDFNRGEVVEIRQGGKLLKRLVVTQSGTERIGRSTSQPQSPPRQPQRPAALVKAFLEFDNQTSGAVALIWVDHSGNERQLQMLDPGKKARWQTFVGERWLARDAAKNTLNDVRVTDENQQVAVGNVAGPPSQTAVPGPAPAPPPGVTERPNLGKPAGVSTFTIVNGLNEAVRLTTVLPGGQEFTHDPMAAGAAARAELPVGTTVIVRSAATSQEIARKSLEKLEERIDLPLENPAVPAAVEVPDLAGLTPEVAEARLRQLGLVPQQTLKVSADVTSGSQQLVAGQIPAAGTIGAIGSTVTYVVLIPQPADQPQQPPAEETAQPEVPVFVEVPKEEARPQTPLLPQPDMPQPDAPHAEPAQVAETTKLRSPAELKQLEAELLARMNQKRREWNANYANGVRDQINGQPLYDQQLDQAELTLNADVGEIARGFSRFLAETRDRSEADFNRIYGGQQQSQNPANGNLDPKGHWNMHQRGEAVYAKFGRRTLFAENANYTGSPESVVDYSWWVSDGHRQNMLHKEVTTVGIGVAQDQRGQLYYTAILIKPEITSREPLTPEQQATLANQAVELFNQSAATNLAQNDILMSRARHFSKTSADAGKTSLDLNAVDRDVNQNGYRTAEIITHALTGAEAKDAVRGWERTQGLFDAIKNQSCREIGIGATRGADGRIYWVLIAARSF